MKNHLHYSVHPFPAMPYSCWWFPPALPVWGRPPLPAVARPRYQPLPVQHPGHDSTEKSQFQYIIFNMKFTEEDSCIPPVFPLQSFSSLCRGGSSRGQSRWSHASQERGTLFNIQSCMKNDTPTRRNPNEMRQVQFLGVGESLNWIIRLIVRLWLRLNQPYPLNQFYNYPWTLGTFTTEVVV